MAEISRIISSSLDINAVYSAYTAELAKLVDFDGSSVSVIDLEKNTLTFSYSSDEWQYGRSQQLTGTFSETVIAKPIGRIFESSESEAAHPRYLGMERVLRAGYRSFLRATLTHHDQVIGVLYLRSNTPGAFSERDLEIAARAGRQIAGAISNAQLYEGLETAEKAERERSGELEALYEIARIVSLPGDFSTKAESVLKILADLAGAEWATFRVSREGEPGLHPLASAGPGVEISPPIEVFTEEHQMAMSCIREGMIRVVNDYAAEPNPSPALLAMGIRSVVMIPLGAEGSIVGLVNVISREPNHFTPEIVRLLTAVGDGLGIHLEKARLDEEQQRMLLENQTLTASIQQSYAELSSEIADRERTEEILAERTEDLASVGKMVSEIAHEVNNPVAAVMGYAELLKGQNLPGEAREDVDAIYSQSQRAAEVVKSLLLYSRRPEPDKRYIDVSGAVNQALALIDQGLTENNIEIRKEFESGLPKTMADEHQLTQVFFNVVVNAVQTMMESKGEGTLRIKGWQKGPNLRFSFSDDGPGFSHENLGKVFDPFFTTKEVGKGTGMGLSMCSRIVRAHGGTIWAESEEGDGATFYVELPVESPVDKDMEIKGSAILMVDDQKVFRRVWHRVLSKEGHVVDVVSGGEEALQAIRKNRYECILMDIRMPGMGGEELYQRIKGSDERMANRVIFATGDDLNSKTKEFLESTGNTWLAKPFTIEELKAKIQECLSK
jgi:signal transduction histidine kinase